MDCLRALIVVYGKPMDKELLVNSLRHALNFDNMPEITDSMILEMTEGTFLRRKTELAISLDKFWKELTAAMKI